MREGEWLQRRSREPTCQEGSGKIYQLHLRPNSDLLDANLDCLRFSLMIYLPSANIYCNVAWAQLPRSQTLPGLRPDIGPSSKPARLHDSEGQTLEREATVHISDINYRGGRWRCQLRLRWNLIHQSQSYGWHPRARQSRHVPRCSSGAA
jgi:hypothetical protein